MTDTKLIAEIQTTSGAEITHIALSTFSKNKKDYINLKIANGKNETQLERGDIFILRNILTEFLNEHQYEY